MKQTVDGYDIPIYRNSLIYTYQTQTKGDFAWHLNFSRLDPVFDFQIIYREILSAANVLDAHIHENSAEVAFVLRGEQFFRIDDTDYRVLCGEMLIAPPASVHSSNHRIMPKGEIYNLTINPACIRALLPPDAAESADTLAALLCAPPKKIETAQTWMYNPQVQPQEIWRKLSFSSEKYFNEVFKRYTGLTVLQYYKSIHHNN